MNPSNTGPATVRPFEAATDYPAMAAVRNSAGVGSREGPDLLRYYDETKDQNLLDLRMVAEQDGGVRGVAEYYQNPGMYHPRKFYLSLAVAPSYRRRGLGAALYDALLTELNAHDPITLRTKVKESCEDGLHFAASRGFVEEKRDWESALDVAAFDPSPYQGLMERLAGGSIAITSLKDLEGDSDMPRKFHELFSTARLDVPSPDPPTAVSFENYYQWTFESPDYSPEGSIVALDGDRYIGMSQLWKDKDSPDVFTGLTAVLREYRGRGVALAMKLAGIAFAKRIGAPRIRTDNDSTNAPMLAINNRLGFVREPALITYRKDFGDKGAR